MGFLVLVLDGSLPGLAHAANRLVRALAQLHQQAAGDRPGAAQTSLAVHEHVEAEPQTVPDGLARH